MIPSRNFILNLLVSSVLCLGYMNLNAQTFKFIRSVSVLPESPSTSDEIKVICHTFFPQTDGKLDSFNYSINGNLIEITGYYCYSIFNSPSSSIDTMNIGPLKFGSYNLVFFFKSCKDKLDTSSMQFNVGYANLKSQFNNQLISMFPNPCSNQISLKFIDTKRYNIVILDFNGKTLAEFSLEGKLNYSLPINIQNGIYQLRIIGEGYKSFTKCIIVN